jgi:hypothetical protein
MPEASRRPCCRTNTDMKLVDAPDWPPFTGKRLLMLSGYL